MSIKTPRGKRIKSIDMLRGVVMVIMALDHVRDYFHTEAFLFDPTDLEQTYPALFLTRFVTHFCAPVFVFLAGTSAFFVGSRKNKKFLSAWLLKRGLWLIFAEFTIIKFAWAFKLDYSVLMLQVIWVLGLGMIFLAAYIHLPRKLGVALALLAVFGHNLLDIYNAADPFTPSTGLREGIWRILHVFGLVPMGSSTLLVAYPAIPWIFVMPLGYYFGVLYKPDVEASFRIKKLWQLGLSITILFLILRGIWQGWFYDQMVIIGRVPMFFYVVHLYLIHILAMIAAVATGFNASDMVIDIWINFQTELKGYGFDLWVVYLIWIAIVLALWPVCVWYNKYKTENRDKWWLSYL